MKKEIEETYARAEKINPGIVERIRRKQQELLRFAKEVENE